MIKQNGVVFYRRRREGRTDYGKRLTLLKSRLPRLVVRKTNAHTIVQFIKYAPDGDVVLATATTKQLEKLGWKGAMGNSAAAYLTGFALAKKAPKDLGEVIVDIGFHTHKAGSRLYAAVRGVIDGGVKVRCSQEILAQDTRISGEHLSESVRKQFEEVKQKL